MRLLSRNAEALFWLARYLERAASIARVIEMQSSFGGQDREKSWSWMLNLYADEERYRKRCEEAPTEIIEFYTTDISNPGSIRSCIHWGRENARALRPFIPLEMWVQLNAFHTAVEALDADDIGPARLPRTCSEVRAGCLAQIGVAEATLYRDEGYTFFKLGLMVERADQTSRLLDVKFAQAAVEPRSSDPANEFVFWSTILRTAAAYQVFHRLETGGATPDSVARFLILDRSHPRSIGYCVHEIGLALQQLRGTFNLSRTNRAMEACEVLMEGLLAAAKDRTLATRLHQFNDWVQASLIALTAQIDAAFFRPTPPDKAAAAVSGGSTRGASQKQEQRQS